MPLVQRTLWTAPHQHQMVMPDGTVMIMNDAAITAHSPDVFSALMGSSAATSAGPDLQCWMDAVPDHPIHAPLAHPFHEFAMLAVIEVTVLTLSMAVALILLLSPTTNFPTQPFRPPIPAPR
jgi:hypothetical protein